MIAGNCSRRRYAEPTPWPAAAQGDVGVARLRLTWYHWYAPTVATLADIAAGRHSIDAERVAARRRGHKNDRPVGNDRMLSSRDARPAR